MVGLSGSGVLAVVGEVQAQLVELMLHFFQGLAAEIANLDHLILGFADEVSNRVDVCAFEAVEAAH